MTPIDKYPTFKSFNRNDEKVYTDLLVCRTNFKVNYPCEVDK